MNLAPLGQVLLKLQLVDEKQLETALSHHRHKKIPLGRSLVILGYCTPEQVTRALASQYGVGYVDLVTQRLDSALSSLVPREVAVEYGIVPLQLDPKRNVLSIALKAPVRFHAIDAARRSSGMQRIIPFMASDDGIQSAIAQIYGAPEKSPPDSPNVADLPVVELFGEEVTSDGAPSTRRPILLFGWNAEATEALKEMCATRGLITQTATAKQVLNAERDDVLISPLKAFEGVIATGQTPPGQWIVAGHMPEREVRLARKLGAKAYLPTPVVSKLLLRTVCRLMGEWGAGMAPTGA